MLMMMIGLSITLFTGDHISEIGNDIIRVRQPITFLSQKLEADLNLSTSTLNAYLLTGNPENLQHYEALRGNIRHHLRELEERFPVQTTQSSRWEKINTLLLSYNTLASDIIALHEDNTANYPGVTLASERLHPLNMNYQTLINGLIDQVSQRQSNTLPARLHEIRRLWMLMTSEFRVFMGTRSENNRVNTQLYLDQHDKLLQALANSSDFPDEYVLEIEELMSISSEYRKHLPAVIEIFSGEQWRKDAYIMKSEIQPLVANLQQRLSELARQQIEATEKSGVTLSEELGSLRTYNLYILFISLLLGGLISYVISRGIYTMIGRIKESTRKAEVLKNTAEEHARSLERSLEQLENTQAQLVQSERLASLGGLVAGIAHEINTPLGISVTATSHIAGKAMSLRKELEEGALKKSALLAFLDEHAETMGILTPNLQRASELVRSFKQVAVDQTSEQLREFEVCGFLEDVLRSLHPEMKNRPINTELDCNGPHTINSYPGALSQIVTNLVVNSLRHAYAESEVGQIKLWVESSDTELILLYSDNGCGIPKSHLDKIFDPFFTTKRGQGGSGLGLHIIYNIVTGQLGGTIECESREGEGTIFSIRFPKNVEQGGSQTL